MLKSNTWLSARNAESSTERTHKQLKWVPKMSTGQGLQSQLPDNSAIQEELTSCSVCEMRLKAGNQVCENCHGPVKTLPGEYNQNKQRILAQNAHRHNTSSQLSPGAARRAPKKKPQPKREVDAPKRFVKWSRQQMAKAMTGTHFMNQNGENLKPMQTMAEVWLSDPWTVSQDGQMYRFRDNERFIGQDGMKICRDADVITEGEERGPEAAMQRMHDGKRAMAIEDIVNPSRTKVIENVPEMNQMGCVATSGEAVNVVLYQHIENPNQEQKLVEAFAASHAGAMKRFKHIQKTGAEAEPVPTAVAKEEIKGQETLQEMANRMMRTTETDENQNKKDAKPHDDRRNPYARASSSSNNGWDTTAPRTYTGYAGVSSCRATSMPAQRYGTQWTHSAWNESTSWNNYEQGGKGVKRKGEESQGQEWHSHNNWKWQHKGSWK